MTVFNKIKILIIFLLFGISMACVNEKKDCCIIFWDYEPELTLEYLNHSDFSECLKRFPDYIRIDFEKVESFDIENKIFFLREDFYNQKFREQYKKSKDGKICVSVIIDGKIILNGVNMNTFEPIGAADQILELEPFLFFIDTGSIKRIVISEISFPSKEMGTQDILVKKIAEKLYYGQCYNE